jgi:hypothetical protein
MSLTTVAVLSLLVLFLVVGGIALDALRRSRRFQRAFAELERGSTTPPAFCVAANLGAVAQSQDAEAVALARRCSAAYDKAARAHANANKIEPLQVGPGWFGVALMLKSER